MNNLIADHKGANCVQLVECLIRLNPKTVCFVLSRPSMIHIEHRFQKTGSGLLELQNEVDDKVESMYAYVVFNGNPVMIQHMSDRRHTKVFGESTYVEQILMEIADLATN